MEVTGPWATRLVAEAPHLSSPGPRRPFVTAQQTWRRSTAVGLASISIGVPLAAGTSRRRTKPAYKVLCRGEDEVAAERALAELEAELEALEDEMEEERMRKADLDEAETKSKIEQRFKDAAPGLDSEVVAGRGSDAVGVAGTVCVCGVAGSDTVAQRVLRRLEEEAAETPVFLDFKEVTRMKFEEVDEVLKNCTAAVICPEPSEASEQSLEQAKLALRSVLTGAEELKQVILLSHVGAQDNKGGFNLGAFFSSSGTSWASIEDELTSTVRARSANKALRYVIVRASDPPTSPSSGSRQVRCLPPDESVEGGFTSPETAAEAIYQVFNRSVNSNFVVLEDGGAGGAGSAGSPDWGELLLPFVGPEVWRIDVGSVTRTVLFLQQWADEFFGPGKSALRQGVKTPVQFERTSSGVIFKFRPLTAKDARHRVMRGRTCQPCVQLERGLRRAAKDPFESLEEGGLEFIVEAPKSGNSRLRARRCAYGWKVVPKENSERALLEKFKKDWEEVERKK